MSDLLLHPAWERFNPARRQLVRMAAPLADTFNPFASDGVTIVPVLLYGETFNSKSPVSYELVKEGAELGAITPDTNVIAASSGNTGRGIAQLCKALNVPCEIVMNNDTPDPKIGVITALGSPITTTILTSGTVKYAREKGLLPGNYDTDQYGRKTNIKAQKKHMVPQLFQANNGRIDIAVTAGGTLGTGKAIQEWVEENETGTAVVLAYCAGDEEVPGARNRKRIKSDVTIARLEDFKHQIAIGRFESFLASYAMFSEIEWTPGGPSSGLALFAALSFVLKHKRSGTLDQFRNKKDGKIRLVFLCPDDYSLYGALYKSVLNERREFFLSSIPITRLLETA